MTEQEAQRFLVALGAEIASWRKFKKLSREQLADKVGVSQSTIGRIERGDSVTAAGASDVWRIARALGLSLSSLVSRAEETMQLAAQEQAQGAQAQQQSAPTKPVFPDLPDGYVLAANRGEPEPFDDEPGDGA
ncbi:MAG: helix-turn-helix transcriptional regulator [Aeromicrobium sp.]|uniref:helix-turn-helix domain-containing protein n=1 Tax=Aeromicrobium sp. TaxID=1871063 RepID=UPI0039E2B5AF